MYLRYLLFSLSTLLLALAPPAPATAQTPVYEAFAVDSAAAPRGGPFMLETFLSVNFKKPFMAQVANTSGRIVVKAVVEPNGHITDVQLVRGLRPDCNQEALRVMRLFNAWKPALKDGKSVRQAITYAIPVKPNPTLFTKRLGDNRIQQTVYYGSNDQIKVSDNPPYPPTDYMFRVVMPVDTLGRVVGDAKAIVKRVGGHQFVMKDATYLLSRERLTGKDSTEIRYQTALKDNCCRLFGPVQLTDETGRVRSDAQYSLIKRNEQTYSVTGMVEKLYEYIWDGSRTITWHPNGQLNEFRETKISGLLPGQEVIRFLTVCDSAGNYQIQYGQGSRTWAERVKSRRDTATYTQFVQRATYSQGLKHGLCSGAYADGSYSYQETYENGTCLGGFAIVAERDTIRYTQARQSPTLVGGKAAADQLASQVATYLKKPVQFGDFGGVKVDFRLDQAGRVLDRSVVWSTKQLPTDTILRLFDNTKELWQPAMVRGEPIEAAHVLLISYDFGQNAPTVSF
ncbi:energy transducer TonB [Fibrivirga algicola]|uniref:TonB C-terminal domain-containing protein n=1 Tax=Fibrivirga algicola TaxID=2950420 RepID=A0ABX0QCU2_9BACT|nr:energy transducer TonB [Fibrivirga algicola]NID09807.1 hypothetical protein [Fibrivirga algicola]